MTTTKNNNTNQRLCIIDKKTYDKKQLIKITYIKTENQLYFNDLKVKGRSVYINQNNLNKIESKKINGIIFGRLKVSPNQNVINQIKDFFEKEHYYEKTK